MVKLSHLLILISCLTNAVGQSAISSQSVNEKKSTGILWATGLTWQQIKEKAKNENRFIFIDAYTTWCGPCKQMEKETFSNDTIIHYLNNTFVSFRVQFDTTAKDDAGVKNWYSIARDFSRTYHIVSYPSYLFFDTAGNIIHKDVGFKPVPDFLSVLKDAVNPIKQFYTRLKYLKENALDRGEYPKLTKFAKDLNETETELTIVRNFFDQIANKVTEPSSLTKEEWKFIAGYSRVLKSDDKIFDWCINKDDQIDKIVDDGFAKKLADGVIYREEVYSNLETYKKIAKEPDWEKIKSNILRKYGQEYVNDKIVLAKVGWYKDQKRWVQYTKYLVQLIDGRDINKVPSTWQGAYYLNNNAWEVFLRSDEKRNKKQIRAALKWVSKCIEMPNLEPGFAVNHLDTKANLLYKLGREKEAISLEEKSVNMAEKLKRQDLIKDFSNNLEKMKAGIKTWE